MTSIKILESIQDYMYAASTSPEVLAEFYRTQKHVKFMMILNGYYRECYLEFELLISETAMFEDTYNEKKELLYFILNKHDTLRMYGHGVVVSVWCETKVDQSLMPQAHVIKYIKSMDKISKKHNLQAKFLAALKHYQSRVTIINPKTIDDGQIKQLVRSFLENGTIDINKTQELSLEQFFIFREIIVYTFYIKYQDFVCEKISDDEIDLFIKLVQVPILRN